MTTFITPADVGDISAAAVDVLLLHRRRSEAIDRYKGALDGQTISRQPGKTGNTEQQQREVSTGNQGFSEALSASAFSSASAWNPDVMGTKCAYR